MDTSQIIKQGHKTRMPSIALLFILVPAIMAISIRKNQNVQGIRVEKTEHKICQLADDTTILQRIWNQFLS